MDECNSVTRFRELWIVYGRLYHTMEADIFSSNWTYVCVALKKKNDRKNVKKQSPFSNGNSLSIWQISVFLVFWCRCEMAQNNEHQCSMHETRVICYPFYESIWCTFTIAIPSKSQLDIALPVRSYKNYLVYSL